MIQRRTSIGSESGETAEPMIRIVYWSGSGQTEDWRDAKRADELPPDIAISIPFEVVDQMAAIVAACRETLTSWKEQPTPRRRAT